MVNKLTCLILITFLTSSLALAKVAGTFESTKTVDIFGSDFNPYHFNDVPNTLTYYDSTNGKFLALQVYPNLVTKKSKLVIFDKRLNIQNTITLDASMYESGHFGLRISEENPNAAVVQYRTNYTVPSGRMSEYYLFLVNLKTGTVTKQFQSSSYGEISEWETLDTKVFHVNTKYSDNISKLTVFDILTGNMEFQSTWPPQKDAIRSFSSLLIDKENGRAVISVEKSNNAGPYFGFYDFYTGNLISEHSHYRTSSPYSKYITSLDGNSVFIDDSIRDSISLYSIVSGKKIATYPIPHIPYKNPYDDNDVLSIFENLLFVSNERNNFLNVYDLKTGQLYRELDCSQKKCRSNVYRIFRNDSDEVKVELGGRSILDLKSGDVEPSLGDDLGFGFVFHSGREVFQNGRCGAYKNISISKTNEVALHSSSDAIAFTECEESIPVYVVKVLSKDSFIIRDDGGRFQLFERSSAPKPPEVDCSKGKNPGIGDICNGGAIFAGQYGSQRYMITPGNCSYLGSNFCSGGVDTLEHVWRHSEIATGATDLNDGEVNTQKLAVHYENIAANYCAQMRYGGYEDWYLPSINELQTIFVNRDKIPGINLDFAFYWSSTEYLDAANPHYSDHYIKVLWSNGNYVTNESKTEVGGIRCIRKIR